MQQDEHFITADFLYMFRASGADHQEHKMLTRQPPVQVVMVAVDQHSAIWRSADARNIVEKVCSNKICLLLYHVGVLFNLR